MTEHCIWNDVHEYIHSSKPTSYIVYCKFMIQRTFFSRIYCWLSLAWHHSSCWSCWEDCIPHCISKFMSSWTYWSSDAMLLCVEPYTQISLWTLFHAQWVRSSLFLCTCAYSWSPSLSKSEWLVPFVQRGSFHSISEHNVVYPSCIVNGLWPSEDVCKFSIYQIRTTLWREVLPFELMRCASWIEIGWGHHSRQMLKCWNVSWKCFTGPCLQHHFYTIPRDEIQWWHDLGTKELRCISVHFDHPHHPYPPTNDRHKFSLSFCSIPDITTS